MISVFIALKPCLISGVQYFIDDDVDVSKLTDEQIAALCKRKVIVKAGESEGEYYSATLEETMLSVPVITKESTLTLPMTGEQLCTVVSVIQRPAEEAVELVKDINEEPTLILIHRLDSRKTVQAVAKERAEALTSSKDGDA